MSAVVGTNRSDYLESVLPRCSVAQYTVQSSPGTAIERTSYHLWHNLTDYEASMRQHAYRLLLLLLLLSSVLAQPQRPSFSIGSLLFENKRSPDSIMSAHVRPTQQHAQEQGTPIATEQFCASSAAADLQNRLSMPQWDPEWSPNTFEDKRQGPYLSFYPRVSPEHIPEGCVPLQWAHQRLLAAVDDTIRMGLNYWWVKAAIQYRRTQPQQQKIRCSIRLPH